MSSAVRVLRLGKIPWRTSQAVYHAVAECMDEGGADTLILAVPEEPYVCAGFHQNPQEIFDVEHCRERGLGILRRRIGGGAVYLDSDQIFFQCIFHASRSPARVDRLFRSMLSPAVEALRLLGFPAGLEGVNEITIGGRRISGTGAGRIGDASVVVGNILRDFPYEEMIRAWRLPTEAFRRLAAEGIREHVTTLRRESADTVSMEEIEKALFASFAAAFGRPVSEGRFTAREEDAIARLEAELTAPSWLDAHPAPSASPRLKIARGVYVCEHRYDSPGGPVTLTARLNGGSIEALVIGGPGGGPGESAHEEDKEFQAALNELTAGAGGDE